MSAVAGLTALILAAVVIAELSRALAAMRRRVRMNRVMHELRRPIQSLSLAIECERRDLVAAASWMEQVNGALADLDAEINGRTRATERVDVSLGAIADGVEDRWRGQGVRVEAPVSGPMLRVDTQRLGAALDNLVDNALGHGSGSICVRALSAPGVARLEVRDDGPSTELPETGDSRHGHGLAVAGAVARDHGGALAPPHRLRDGGTVAALTLPVAKPRGR